MGTGRRSAGSQFTVDLGAVKLPPLVEKEVEAEIRAVVLRAVAEDARSGDASARIVLRAPIHDHMPGGTLGLILYPGTPTFPGEPSGGPLVPEDHTRIMQAIMDHPMEVLRELPDRKSRPSGREVLQAALNVDQIGTDVKSRIQTVIDLLPLIEEALANAPEDVKRLIDRLEHDLANKPIERQIQLLRESSARVSGERAELARGLDAAARVIEDGRDTIYSPEHRFYRIFGADSSSSVARDTVSDVKDADTIGASGGGFAGTVIPGLGTAAGAAAGGAGASAGAAIGHLIAWLID